MARKLRVGFVGLGRVFDLNVRAYLDHPDAEVSALCDADPAILARRAAEHPGEMSRFEPTGHSHSGAENSNLGNGILRPETFDPKRRQ
jgi:predicted dehydrogenase